MPKDNRTPEQRILATRAILDHLLEELARIDAEHGEKRRAAIAASGLPGDLVEAVLGNSRLTSPDHYDHIEHMAQEQSAVVPRKLGRPLPAKGGGPITKAARSLGISVLELSSQLGVKYASCRNWDRPDRRIPDDIQPKLDRLLAKGKPAK